jgi:cytidylate kinase
MSVITISRQLASHGCEIGAHVASTLGFRFIDREIIHRAAEEAGVPKIALEEIAYEGRRNLAERILRAVNAMPPVPGTAEAWRREAARPVGQPWGGIFSPAVPSSSVTLKDYVDMVEMVIRDLAREGNVVIAGRGSQVILHDAPGALHVQVVAPFDYRVTTLAQREGIEEGEAAQRIRASDAARRDYLREYHRVDWLDPTLYDLVINTHSMPAESAAAMIVDAYGRLVAEDHG